MNFWDGVKSIFGGFLLAITIIAIGVGAGFGVAALIMPIDNHLVRRECESFGTQSNRETKYVQHTLWNNDCLTLLDNGKWISIDDLGMINIEE